MKIAKIDLRVTPEFKEAVQAAAAKANLSVTAFLMAAAIEKMYGLKPSQRVMEGE
jgi:uncharacterized protein (DUF1778 family)